MTCKQDGSPAQTAKGAITAALVNGKHERNTQQRWAGIACCLSQSARQLSAGSVPLTAGVGTGQPKCKPMGCALLHQVEEWSSVKEEG